LWIRLCSEAGPETENISGKKTEIKNKWRNLQGAIQTYRDRLSIAANIQAFQVKHMTCLPSSVDRKLIFSKDV